MKIVLAIDSYKGCLTSEEVEQTAAQALREAFPKCQTDCIPIADGGEGTLQVLVKQNGGTQATLWVQNPCMKRIRAQYGISADGQTAYIEMAEASGLTLISETERNPMKTSTFGTGELIADALSKGCRNFIVGIGGSATNDAGTGMLQALGYRFLDKEGHKLGQGGEILEHIARIDESGKHPLLENAHFIVACDVQNPFYGPQGAACIFAPQKGATPAMMQQLDQGLKHFAKVIQQHTGKDIQQIPGSGAAGGLGGGMMALLNAELRQGAGILLEHTRFKELSADADLIITGEGKADHQTLMGKIPYHILQQSLPHHIPVLLMAGKVEDRDLLLHAGFRTVESITPEFMPLAMAMKPEVARENIRHTVVALAAAHLEPFVG